MHCIGPHATLSGKQVGRPSRFGLHLRVAIETSYVDFRHRKVQR